MDKDELKNELQPLFDQIAEKKQELYEGPNNFIIGYYKKSNDELIGYHASTFCQLTEDILKAKRYQGDPMDQLAIISKNFNNIMTDNPKDSLFPSIVEQVIKQFEGLKFEDVYLNYIDLAEGTPYSGNTKIQIL